MESALNGFAAYLQWMHESTAFNTRCMWQNTIEALLKAEVSFSEDGTPPSALVLLAAKERIPVAMRDHVPKAVDAYCRFLQTEMPANEMRSKLQRDAITLDRTPARYLNAAQAARKATAEMLPIVAAAKEFIQVASPTLPEFKSLDASNMEFVATGDRSCAKLHLPSPLRHMYVPKSELPNLHALLVETYALAVAFKAERVIPKVFPEKVIQNLEHNVFRSPIEAVRRTKLLDEKWKAIDLGYLTMPIDADSSSFRAWLLKVKSDAAKSQEKP